MHRNKHHIYAGKILHQTKLISSSKHVTKSKKIPYKCLQFHFTKRYYEINELECKTYINFDTILPRVKFRIKMASRFKKVRLRSSYTGRSK